ncbi:PQQ-dependent sugar dehydrogenase [Mucilaginibacter calamicampi]|uniref:PQQ-dependent sugar dehydrogenase n=1 Tax=Mucilaginibacter calamicampi TaxID=1302352 RepID=A0ABW2YTM4_9SPHI
MTKNFHYPVWLLLAAVCLTGFSVAIKLTDYKADLKLPAGFSASIVADSLGTTRHIAVTDNGDIYVKMYSAKKGSGVYFLSDTDNDGRMDRKTGFATYPGTGIKIHNGYLYSASNNGVFRYKLNSKSEVVNPDKPETIVQGLVERKTGNTKSIALDDKGNLYVAIGSYSEECREKDSNKGMPGCPLLDSIGGIWKFKADKLNQTYADATHYARGIKSAIGVEWNTNTRSLFATQHGRANFDDRFPQYYTAQQNAEIPAETVYELHEGADAGWPFVYYDHIKKKKMLTPEYGGDGIKTVEDKYLDPAIAFPAHLAPNDLLFYNGDQFPARYKNGAFVALHSQSTVLKKGYFVAFVPFKNGKPAGEWEIFAELAGVDLQNPSGPIKYRPSGLAEGPDGSLYIADDVRGAIFKVTYKGK